MFDIDRARYNICRIPWNMWYISVAMKPINGLKKIHHCSSNKKWSGHRNTTNMMGDNFYNFYLLHRNKNQIYIIYLPNIYYRLY